MFNKMLLRTLVLTVSLMLVLPSPVIQAVQEAKQEHAIKQEEAIEQGQAVKREQAEPHVLLLYDSLAKGTSREGNVEALQRLLAAYGVKVTIASLDTYKQGTLQQYTKVIGVHNASDLIASNPYYGTDFDHYAGDYLHIGTRIPALVQSKMNMRTRVAEGSTVSISIGPYSQEAIQIQEMQHVRYIGQTDGKTYGTIASSSTGQSTPFGVVNGRYGYVPYLEQGNLSELAIAYVLKDWLGITKESSTYLVFKEIYPFSDLKLLQQMADQLYDAGIPFIVSVRPVFSNADYPAMKRYLETLKYVQSRNGSIIVNAPVVASTITQLDRDLNTQLASFVDVLANYGIAPLGFGAEMYWSYDQHYAAEGMDFFDSVILFPNERLMYKSRGDTSKSFPSSMYSLQPRFLQQFEHAGTAIQDFPMNTALTFDFVKDGKELHELIRTLSDSWIPFADYKQEAHTVSTPKSTVSSRNGLLFINDSRVNVNDGLKQISSDYAYKEETTKSFERLFNVQNKIFIVIILITMVAFGGFFIIGHRLYKRKYMKQRER
ncbi:DUF2334 domain-containing protein [Paenibacillus sp. 481]|uniref:DUF2334 domain-containing protein n=1 Tax=Paenibacillus sp. 481 TaxID=2835869 RepID=UPI001E30D6EA|nr:DUF2334 domain-containing protein [Paenibacillus sp. 481]UHA73539.1 DUF2334 domain-containing protein [Paenibacillus sp. 481]